MVQSSSHGKNHKSTSLLRSMFGKKQTSKRWTVKRSSLQKTDFSKLELLDLSFYDLGSARGMLKLLEDPDYATDTNSTDLNKKLAQQIITINDTSTIDECTNAEDIDVDSNCMFVCPTFMFLDMFFEPPKQSLGAGRFAIYGAEDHSRLFEQSLGYRLFFFQLELKTTKNEPIIALVTDASHTLNDGAINKSKYKTGCTIFLFTSNPSIAFFLPQKIHGGVNIKSLATQQLYQSIKNYVEYEQSVHGPIFEKLIELDTEKNNSFGVFLARPNQTTEKEIYMNEPNDDFNSFVSAFKYTSRSDENNHKTFTCELNERTVGMRISPYLLQEYKKEGLDNNIVNLVKQTVGNEFVSVIYLDGFSKNETVDVSLFNSQVQTLFIMVRPLDPEEYQAESVENEGTKHFFVYTVITQKFLHEFGDSHKPDAFDISAKVTLDEAKSLILCLLASSNVLRNLRRKNYPKLRLSLLDKLSTMLKDKSPKKKTKKKLTMTFSSDEEMVTHPALTTSWRCIFINNGEYTDGFIFINKFYILFVPGYSSNVKIQTKFLEMSCISCFSSSQNKIIIASYHGDLFELQLIRDHFQFLNHLKFLGIKREPLFTLKYGSDSDFESKPLRDLEISGDCCIETGENIYLRITTSSDHILYLPIVAREDQTLCSHFTKSNGIFYVYDWRNTFFKPSSVYLIDKSKLH